MLSNGKNVLSQLRFIPYYFVDANLTPIIADALAYCGHDCDSVHKLYKGVTNRDDTLIISHLGNYGRQKSVWITSDVDAKKVYARYIISKQNSVLWVFRPPNGLSALHELLVMCLIIEPLNDLIMNAQQALYLRATLLMPHKKARLERLISPLTSTKMEFKKVSLV